MSARVMEGMVECGGAKRPLRISSNTLCAVEESTGLNVLAGEGLQGFRGMRALCFAALQEGARKRGADRDFTVEDVGDWMDDAPALVMAVLDLYADAYPLKVEEAEGVEDPQQVLQAEG